MTDETGTKVSQTEYQPYGKVSQQTGTDVTPYKFTGKELDNTGLYFYSARYYDPEIGRFISPDSFVQSPYDPQTLNRYTYCRNNPLKYVDPSGHFFGIIIAAIVAIVKAAAAFAVAHPIITGAILGATFNTAFHASSINSFGSFVTYAAVGAVSGAVGGGVGSGVGSAFGSFWGTLAGAGSYGLVGGFGNAAYRGASFGQALLSGAFTAGIAAATAGVLYGGAKVVGKVANFIKNAKAQGKVAGVKTPIGQQGQGSATSSLNPNKGEVASGSQALSSRGKGNVDVIELEPIIVRPGGKPTGYRYVGAEEAAKAARTGYVPNATRSGGSKPVFYTPEEPISSASQAQKVYNLPKTPTHRIGLDTSKTTNMYGGNVGGGSGIEMMANERIPATDIYILGE